MWRLSGLSVALCLLVGVGTGVADESPPWGTFASGSGNVPEGVVGRPFVGSESAAIPSGPFDLAYTRYEGGYPAGIVLSTADGTDQEVLISDGMEPQFSPDGSQIAFVSLPGGELSVINPDGSGRRSLTPGIIEYETHTVYGFSWSPDGERLVFSAHGFDEFNRPDLWVVNSDGSGITQLTDEFWVKVTGPAWSPDGRYIAACWTDDRGSESYVRLFTPGGTAVGLEFVHSDCSYSWNSDGSALWYSHAGEIFDYPPDSSPRLRAIGHNPIPSPDGDRLLFERFFPDVPELFVRYLDGGAVQRLTDNDFHDFGLSWSPDGTLVAFMSDATFLHEYSVFVMNANGTGVVQISRNLGADRDLTWAPQPVMGPPIVPPPEPPPPEPPPPEPPVLPPGGTFVDDNGNVHEGFIEAIAAEGITRGCNPPDNDRFCPDKSVTRGQMAAFLVRALGLTDDGGGNTFVDDDGSTFESDIAKLAAAGITRGCNPPDNDRFCPDDPVRRDQMASFLGRALNLTPIQPPDTVDRLWGG